MKNQLASTDLSDTKPLILKNSYETENLLRFQVDSAIDFGSLLIDGIGDAIWPQAQNINAETVAQTGFGILQATRARIKRTEFISFPSCGLTPLEIEKTLLVVNPRPAPLRSRGESPLLSSSGHAATRPTRSLGIDSDRAAESCAAVRAIFQKRTWRA